MPSVAACFPAQAREQQELSEFAAAEHQLLTEQERGLAAEAAQWRADAAAATAQLAEARQRLVETDAALLQSDEEVGAWGCGRTLRCRLAGRLAVRSGHTQSSLACCWQRPTRKRRARLQAKQLRGELTAAQGAAGAAAEVTAEWRQRAEQYDRDRQAAASNIR